MSISRARIVNGVWTRNVPWQNGGEWRTDMFKTVLRDERLQTARFVLKNGTEVFISAGELRRVLVGGNSHYFDDQIWGPFNINPATSTLDGKPVKMEVKRVERA